MHKLKMLMLMDLIWFLILGATQNYITLGLFGMHQEIVDESIRKYIYLIF
jgi:hypothetical protein